MNKYYVIAFLSVMIASFSQILLKSGANKVYQTKVKEYLNRYVICGYGLLFCSMVFTIFAYSGIDFLNVPIIEAVGYVLVPILSALFFKEKVTFRKIIGIVCILFGIGIYYL
ncbi:MAG: EamA family transporter [Lachnospiraceae bacterium]